MCSITAGTNTLKVKTIAQLSKVRGTFSHSIFYIDKYNLSLTSGVKSIGELDVNKINIPENHFCIIHQQAPTSSSRSDKFIHPSTIGKNHLWHNGIIKPHSMAKIKASEWFVPIADAELVNWDTHLIHQKLYYEDDLNGIDGAFACIEYCEDEYIEVFRNEIAPMYFDGECFSSIKFEGSESLPPNKRFSLIFEDDEILIEDFNEFETVENPYYFGD